MSTSLVLFCTDSFAMTRSLNRYRTSVITPIDIPVEFHALPKPGLTSLDDFGHASWRVLVCNCDDAQGDDVIPGMIRRFAGMQPHRRAMVLPIPWYRYGLDRKTARLTNGPDLSDAQWAIADALNGIRDTTPLYISEDFTDAVHLGCMLYHQFTQGLPDDLSAQHRLHQFSSRPKTVDER